MSGGTAQQSIDWADVCRVVDQLRGLVAGAGARDAAIIADLAARYGEAVAAVNQRADYCYGLLRQGFLTEVIGECELPPPILEMAAKLDFPERNAFDLLCTSLGITLAPTLRRDLLSELDRAYQMYQGADRMLRQQRLLALADAPLAARLVVLRQLTAAVPDAAAWREDLMQWEKKYFEDIEHVLRNAEGRNLEELRAIQQELESTPWRAPVPESLINRVKSLLAAATREESIMQLNRLAQCINDAHLRGDCANVQQWLSEYEHYLNYVTEEERAAYWSWVAAAAAWIREKLRQQEQERLQWERGEKLRVLLDSGAHWEEVDAAYRAFRQVCPIVPEWIAQRYAARYRQHQLEKWSVIGMAFLGVAAVLCLLWAIVRG